MHNNISTQSIVTTVQCSTCKGLMHGKQKRWAEFKSKSTNFQKRAAVQGPPGHTKNKLHRFKANRQNMQPPNTGPPQKGKQREPQNHAAKTSIQGMCSQPGSPLANLRHRRPMSNCPGGTNCPGRVCHNREGRSLTLMAYAWATICLSHREKKSNLLKGVVADRYTRTPSTTSKECSTTSFGDIVCIAPFQIKIRHYLYQKGGSWTENHHIPVPNQIGGLIREGD